MSCRFSGFDRLVCSFASFLVLAVLLLLVVAKPRTDSASMVGYHGGISQIKTAYFAVQEEIEGTTNSISDVLKHWYSDDGLFLVYLINGNKHPPLALNPNLLTWRSPETHSNEIAAYWPWPMTNDNNEVGLVAICFGGKVTMIRGTPGWQPIPIAEKPSVHHGTRNQNPQSSWSWKVGKPLSLPAQRQKTGDPVKEEILLNT